MAALVVFGAIAGCGARARPCSRLAPLPRDRGELHLLLRRYAPAATRLDVSISALRAVAGDGTKTELELESPVLAGAEMQFDRRIARGRLSPGLYTGLEVVFSHASLARGGERTALLVPETPIVVVAQFAVGARKATMVTLELDYERSVANSYGFEPSLHARAAAAQLPGLVGLVTDAAGHALSVFDPRTRKLVGVVPSGASPQGLVVDSTRGRAYVALAGADAIEVVDVAASEPLQRIRLEPGDEPTELALTPNGQLLLVSNRRTNTVAFIDPAAELELGRVDVGQAPGAVLVDRAGQRAYVLNHLADTISVLDLPNRAVVRAVATEAAPLWAQLDRDGARLFVIHRRSPYMVVYSLPELAELTRIDVGLGAAGLAVDPSTDLVYVAMADAPRVLVYDAFSQVPIDEIAVSAPVTHMAVEDADNTLLALMPARRTLAIIDLTSHALLGEVDVGCDPRRVDSTGARH